MPILVPVKLESIANFAVVHDVIATAVISNPGGVALVPCGSASCLDALELGLNGSKPVSKALHTYC